MTKLFPLEASKEQQLQGDDDSTEVETQQPEEQAMGTSGQVTCEWQETTHF